MYTVKKVEKVSLKDYLSKCSSIERKRVERLIDSLGEIEVSKEFLDGYLGYFDYKEAKRDDLPLVKESLKDLYEISLKYPKLSSISITMIMGEYVKDVFDTMKPLSIFDGMTTKQIEKSFESFIKGLKELGEKSDLLYQEEEDKVDSLGYMYGDRFVRYIKPFVKKYHKSFDEIYESIPYSLVIRKDSDLFYGIAKKELFGARGYPYTFYMSKAMILFGDIESYKGRVLTYSSSLYGDIKCPITTDEFEESLKQKRKAKEYEK